jgi:hypothetical protein
MALLRRWRLLFTEAGLIGIDVQGWYSRGGRLRMEGVAAARCRTGEEKIVAEPACSHSGDNIACGGISAITTQHGALHQRKLLPLNIS